MRRPLRTAIAAALTLGAAACANLESPFSVAPADRGVPKAFAGRSDIDNQLRLAEASMTAGNAAAAISILRRLAREYPFALKPRVALGEALLKADAAQEAARAFEGALKLDGGSREALIGLGRVQLALHQPALALEHFDKAAKGDAKNTAAHNGRAVALDQLGRHGEAQAIYLRLLAADPSNIRIRNNYALSLALAGRYDESADILAGIAAAPDSETRIRQNLALVYGLSGNDGQAAHIARMDLDEEAVANNLQYYQRLRHAAAGAKGAAFLSPSLEEWSSSGAVKRAAGKPRAEAPATGATLPPGRPVAAKGYRAPVTANAIDIQPVGFADTPSAPDPATQESNPAEGIDLEGEPLAVPQQAAPAAPPVALLGEGISGATRAIPLRPSSGAESKIPDQPKTRQQHQGSKRQRDGFMKAATAG